MKLFLDDIRDPSDGSWIVARSCDQAVYIVETNGFPTMVSFDHDLGDGPTGLDFAHYLIERDLDNHDMPGNFIYTVHSANPVGRANILGLLDGYLRYKGGQRTEAR